MSSPTGQAARDASAGSSAPPPAAAPRLVPGRASSVRAFLALCERDLWVTVRHEPFAFLSQALLQPLFFLFVFGRVLPEIGAVEGDYAVQLLPGIVALTLILTALQNTALPLVIEFSFTREIEDRLLAPLPVTWVALEKMLIAAVRGLVAGALIFPLGELILPGGISAGSGTLWLLIIVAPAGAFIGAALGLVLGTAVPPNRISVAFAVVLTPLIFTGATFYPWEALGNLRWFQVITLFNPMTYVSEGMRTALTSTPHMPTVWIIVGMAAALALFGALGLRGFVRRAVD
jgi:ABC-2 type transport system permease protein